MDLKFQSKTSLADLRLLLIRLSLVFVEAVQDEGRPVFLLSLMLFVVCILSSYIVLRAIPSIAKCLTISDFFHVWNQFLDPFRRASRLATLIRIIAQVDLNFYREKKELSNDI